MRNINKPINYLILFSVIIIISSLLIHAGEFLSFGSDNVTRCFSNEANCKCNGPVLKYCDNPHTASNDPNITIDGCKDGDYELQAYWGNNINSWWEIVRDISVINQNTSIDNDYNGLDYVEFMASFWCPNTGSITMLYKNSTNSDDNDWKIITTDTCSGDNDITFTELVQLDDIAGDHTFRAVIANLDSFSNMICGYDYNWMFSETDDLIIEVLESQDKEAPEIEFINPTEGESIEIYIGLYIPIQVNVTDETGVDTVYANISYGSTSLIANFTNITPTLFFYNLTNVTNVGEFIVDFFANDTIPYNASENITNHVNNYTTLTFYVVDTLNINIVTPSLNAYYPDKSLILNFIINDNNTPYSYVNYDLNSAGNIFLNESKRHDTYNGGYNLSFNNSASLLFQSFTADSNYTTESIKISVKKSGSPIDVDVNIRPDNGSDYPSTTKLAIGSINASFLNNSAFTNITIQLNDTLKLNNQTKYWIVINASNITDYIILEAALDNYTGGKLYQNNTYDLMIGVLDLYEYTLPFTAIEGLNTITVCENSTLGIEECSYTQFTSDTFNPYFGAITQTTPLELGTQQIIYAWVYDNTSSAAYAKIEINNANYSMSYISSSGNGRRYRYNSWSISNVGLYQYKIHTADKAGNANSTNTYSFNVTDTTAPSLISINYTPSSDDDVDPNVTLYFNFTLSDYSALNTVYLQYKTNTSNWINITPTPLGGLSYTANFTPLNETPYYYRVYANDTYGNKLSDTDKNIAVSYERDWSYKPVIFNVVLLNTLETINLYNITIINSGDIGIPFSVTEGSGVTYAMTFNNSSFNVSKNQNVTFQVNVTAPNTPGNYPSTANISCVSSCTKKSETVGDYIIVGGEGPYLSLKIFKKVDEGKIEDNLYYMRYWDPVNKKSQQLIAEVKNIAENYDAENITFNFIFPNSSDWIATINNSGNLSSNFSLEKKNFDDTKEISINFSISPLTNMSKLHNISIDAKLIYNGSWRNFSRTVQINVTHEEEEYDSTIIIIDEDSEGSSSPPPSDPAPKISSSTTPSSGGFGSSLTYNLTVISDRFIDLLRGTNKTILVNITNFYRNKYFANITISIIGYYQNQISFSPIFIDELRFNETKTFEVTFNAPSYLGYSRNDMEFIFDYLTVTEGAEKSSGQKNTAKMSFMLIVNEVDREESIECLIRSAEVIRNASSRNYHTKTLEEKFDKQTDAISKMDFTLAKRLCDEIKNDYERIILHEQKLLELKKSIQDSSSRGYHMEDIKRLYNITEEIFSSGDYASLENAIKDLENAYLLQIKIEDAQLFKRLGKFVKNNIKEIIIFLIVMTISGMFTWARISRAIVANKIANLKKEHTQINKKTEELQREYFEKKIFSSDYFKTRLDKNKKRLAEISDLLLKYQSMQLNLNTRSRKMDKLKDNEKKVSEMLQQLQTKYYSEKSIDKDSFEKSNDRYKKTLAEIRKKIKTLELKKKSRFEMLIDLYSETAKKKMSAMLEKIRKHNPETPKATKVNSADTSVTPSHKPAQPDYKS